MGFLLWQLFFMLVFGICVFPPLERVFDEGDCEGSYAECFYD